MKRAGTSPTDRKGNPPDFNDDSDQPMDPAMFSDGAGEIRIEHHFHQNREKFERLGVSLKDRLRAFSEAKKIYRPSDPGYSAVDFLR